MTFRVYYEDTDAGGVVYHANYLKYIERARSDVFFAAGGTPQQGDAHFVVRSLGARYFAPAKLGDVVRVVTKRGEMRSASFKLIQEVWREGLLLFSAEVELALVEAGRPKRMDDALKTFILAAFETLPAAGQG